MGTSRVIKGPKSGAGELGAGGPGTAAMRVKSSSSVKFDKNAKGSTKGMKYANKG